MPECPEITILSQYLSVIKNKYIDNFEILKGKYTRKDIKNIDKIDFSDKLLIKNIDSKGKLLYFKLKNMRSGEIYYMTSHLGLTGEWSFDKNDNDNIRMTICDTKTDKCIYVCYYDPRNFGNIEFLKESELNKKLDELADDVLKTEFTDNDFILKINNYLKVSSMRKKQKIFIVLIKQNKKDGLFSGLGNYLIPEILYDSKISPFREIISLKETELINLANSIKKIVKLSYYNNTTGYMTNFGNFAKIHKKNIDENKFPNYHNDIKLKKIDKFEFKIYQKKTDPLGNKVEKDKILNNGRTIYFVPSCQN